MTDVKITVSARIHSDWEDRGFLFGTCADTEEAEPFFASVAKLKAPKSQRTYKVSPEVASWLLRDAAALSDIYRGEYDAWLRGLGQSYEALARQLRKAGVRP